jgi:hypothetical protein
MKMVRTGGEGDWIRMGVGLGWGEIKARVQGDRLSPKTVGGPARWTGSNQARGGRLVLIPFRLTGQRN